MSQSHCSPVVAISDRQSNRLQNRFDLIQIICYMKFMFVNICKIGLLVLVVQPKQMANSVRRYSLHITSITSKYFYKTNQFIKAGVQWTPLLHERGTAARHYRVGKTIVMLRSRNITVYTSNCLHELGTVAYRATASCLWKITLCIIIYARGDGYGYKKKFYWN